MTFSIFVTVNSITKNNFTDRSKRIPFKANPIKHYRQSLTSNSSTSSRNTHKISTYNGIPGGTT